MDIREAIRERHSVRQYKAEPIAENQGQKHRSKPLSKICGVPEEDMPAWFRNGVKAAMMAPTAINQQKFFITLDGERPVITAGRGAMTGIDLGIVKYNFEAASGHKCG